MGKLLWAERQKIRRSNLVWIAIVTTIMVALLIFIGGQDMGYGVPDIDKPGWFLSIGQSLGTFFALPAVIALFGSYMICREEQDNTINSLRLIPINEMKLTAAKLLITLIFSVLIYMLLFMLTFSTETILHFSDMSVSMFVNFLKSYFLDGVCIFLAISPIIALVSRMKKNYWLALVFTEIFCIGGLFASMSNTLKALYPITAAFTISGYYEATTNQLIMSCISLFICTCIAICILKSIKRSDRFD